LDGAATGRAADATVAAETSGTFLTGGDAENGMDRLGTGDSLCPIADDDGGPDDGQPHRHATRLAGTIKGSLWLGTIPTP